MDQVKLYDTTLRDGMGGRGMSLSVGEKVKVAEALDGLGAHFIEAGFPGSNPKEAELFDRLAELELERATISAFGMTRRRGVRAEDDEALRGLASCFAPVVCLVGKSSTLHVEKVIRASREENLAMIAESIAFCRAQGKRPVFDAEHFFDGYQRNPEYALRVLEAAATNGDYVTLTPAAVQAVEPGIAFSATADDAGQDQVKVSFTATGYTIVSVSQSGKTFTLTKDLAASPVVDRTCGAGCTW